MNSFRITTSTISALLLMYSQLVFTKNLEFVVIITSYNNEKYYYRNLDSVINQKLDQPFEVIYVNDCSTDNTGKLVESYIKNHKAHYIKVVHNAKNVGPLGNLYTTIHSLPDEKIVVTLDGDDFLAHDKALQRVKQEYLSGNIWLTYGQYMYYPSGQEGVCEKFPDSILRENSFRYNTWRSSQLRTFYAGLFKRIHKEDLLHEGQFFPMAGDVAMMFPMLEMASLNHITFIPDVLYMYENTNPLSHHNQNRMHQAYLDRIIRSRTPYQPLEALLGSQS